MEVRASMRLLGESKFGRDAMALRREKVMVWLGNIWLVGVRQGMGSGGERFSVALGFDDESVSVRVEFGGEERANEVRSGVVRVVTRLSPVEISVYGGGESVFSF